MRFNVQSEHFPLPDGPLQYAHIPWDSRLLDMAVFELKFTIPFSDNLGPVLLSWLQSLVSDKPCLVCTKIPTKLVALALTLVRAGFYPVETLIDLQLPLARFRPIERLHLTNLILRQAQRHDLPEVFKIARSVFATDRFHLDPHIDQKKADSRYVYWIESAFQAGEWIFLLEDVESRRTAGFLHVRPAERGFFDMGLAAVHKDYQNSMAGVWLYQEVLKECQTRGLKVATSRISINNLTPLKLAMRFGSIILGAVATFHWFRPA